MEQNHKKKKRIWLWILGWIFCFPIPLTLIIVRSGLKKIVKIILLSILWTLIVLGLILDATGLSEPKKVQTEVKSLTLEERLENYKDSISDFKKDCSIHYENDEKTCTLDFVYNKNSWDETSFVNEVFSDYINFCKKVYDEEDIGSVNYSVSTTMVDQKGNEEIYVVFQLCIEKNSFKEYAWDNMAYKRNVYQTIVSDAELFWIHPGILKEFNEEGFYYLG